MLLFLLLLHALALRAGVVSQQFAPQLVRVALCRHGDLVEHAQSQRSGLGSESRRGHVGLELPVVLAR